jgi:hypothetical protein
MRICASSAEGRSLLLWPGIWRISERTFLFCLGEGGKRVRKSATDTAAPWNQRDRTSLWKRIAGGFGVARERSGEDDVCLLIRSILKNVRGSPIPVGRFHGRRWKSIYRRHSNFVRLARGPLMLPLPFLGAPVKSWRDLTMRIGLPVTWRDGARQLILPAGIMSHCAALPESEFFCMGRLRICS